MASVKRSGGRVGRAIGAAAIIVIVVLLFSLGALAHVAFFVFAFVLLALLVLPLVLSIADRRMRADLERHGLARCLQCGHGLDPSAERGNCPECGHHYVLSKVRRRWWRRYKPRPKKTSDPPPT